MTVSPLAQGQSPKGTLIHLDSDLGKCLTDRGGAAFLADCNVEIANQRWSLAPQTGAQPGSNTFLLVSELGRCLANTGSATSPVLTLGACAAQGSQGWFINAGALSLLDTSNGRQVYLPGNAEDSTVTLLSEANLRAATTGYQWQLGPSVATVP